MRVIESLMTVASEATLLMEGSQQADLARGLTMRASQMDAFLQVARPIRVAQDLLVALGCVVEESVDWGSVESQAATLLDSFRKSPANLTSPQESYKVTVLRDTATEAATARKFLLMEFWRDYVMDRVPPMGLLDILDTLPEYRSAVERVRSLAQRLNMIANGLPTGPKTLSEVQAIASDMARIIAQELPQLPDDVRLFLQRASRPPGPPLSELTPAVWQWLSDHHADGHIVMRLANS